MESQNQNYAGGEGWKPPKMWKMPIFEDLYPQFSAAGEKDDFVYLPKVDYKMDDLAIMSHSSG